MPAEALAPPLQDEHQLPHRERVDAYADMPKDNSVIIDDNVSLYDGSYIGMPSNVNQDVSVIAEMALPDTDSQTRKDETGYRYLAIVKVTDRRTGRATFGLRGLAQKRDGELTGINPISSDPWDPQEREFIPIPSEGSSLTLGRSEKHSDVSGENLWGFKLDDLASRSHVTFVVADGELRARDRSENGTKIYLTLRWSA